MMEQNHTNAHIVRGILRDHQTEEVMRDAMEYHLTKRKFFKYAALNATNVFLTMETSKGIEPPIPMKGHSNATSVERHSKLRMT